MPRCNRYQNSLELAKISQFYPWKKLRWSASQQSMQPQMPACSISPDQPSSCQGRNRLTSILPGKSKYWLCSLIPFLMRRRSVWASTVWQHLRLHTSNSNHFNMSRHLRLNALTNNCFHRNPDHLLHGPRLFRAGASFTSQNI